MPITGEPPLTADRRSRAAASWAFRWSVEVLAARAFRRLTGELRALGVPGALVDACAKAALDEEHHARLCEALARHFGATSAAVIAQGDSLAPAKMPRAEAAIYDVVARCCIGETESTATVVSLLPHTRSPAREAVQVIARDEVEHARLGWRTLAWLNESGREVSFLGAYLPAMLHTGGAPLFDPAASEGTEEGQVEDDVEVAVYGTPTRRKLFEETLEAVIFPGLELNRIPTGPARAWLRAQAARVRRAVEKA